MPRLLPKTPETIATAQAIAKAQQVAFRPKTWARAADVGLNTVWDLIAARELDVVRIGPCMTLILTSPETWLRKKLEEQRAAGDKPLPKIKRVRDLPHEERAKHAPGPSRGNLRLAASD